MRTGVDNPNLFKDIAKVAQQEGIQMITLHARTVKQGYSGKSNWDLIRELKGLVDIPVVGNGDITNPEQAKQMIQQTGCDYVMIGRGAMGNPFLFKQINDYLATDAYQQYRQKNRLEVFNRYVEYAVNYKIRFSNIKQQAIRFSKGLVGGTKLRPKILLAKTIDELKTIMIEAL
jgi:tRNA-dihydrouridine synthase